MKKTRKKVIAIILIAVLLAVAAGFGFIYKLLYPNVMVSGTGDVKILCIGDSLTYGQGVIQNRKKEAYPAILAELLGAEYQVLNYGLCNRTLVSTGNMPYAKEDLAKESLLEDADSVIIMLGTNDSKPDFWNAKRFEEEYIALIQSYQNMDSSPVVYVMLPPYVYREPENSGDCNNTVLSEEVIPAIERAATETGAILIDLYGVTEGHADWYADGLHLNAEGNQAIAEAIAEKITE